MQIWEMGAIAIASNPNSEVLKDLADRQTGRRRGRLSLRALPFMGLVIFWFLISRILRPSVSVILSASFARPGKRLVVVSPFRQQAIWARGRGRCTNQYVLWPLQPVPLSLSFFLDGICSSQSNSLRAPES